MNGDDSMMVGVNCGGGWQLETRRTVVLLDEVLIDQLRSIDRFTSGAISGIEVAALEHEVGDHAVECESFEVERLAIVTEKKR